MGAPRSGAPRTIDDAAIERLVAPTLEEVPRNAMYRSTRAMARRAGMRRTAVSRIWRAFGPQPQRSESFEQSSDSAFADKVRDIVGLYPAPPDRALLEVHLVLDNLKTHKTQLIHDWLVKRPHFHLHFTPTSASWLNLVEGWFALPSRRRLERGAVTGTGDPEEAILASIDLPCFFGPRSA